MLGPMGKAIGDGVKVAKELWPQNMAVGELAVCELTGSGKRGSYIRMVFLLSKSNLVATSALALLSLYISFASIFKRPLLAPIAPKLNSTGHAHFASSIFLTNDYVSVFFTIFMLWTLALFAGRLFHHLRMPPLLGMLLVGMAFANVPFLSHLLVIRTSWNRMLRSMAFVLILLHCGVGLKPEVLRKSLFFCSCLGIVSASAEMLAITLIAHFFFGIQPSAALLFGFILASSSPAVTVPTMIQLQKKQKGTNKGIPTIILASASIDKIFCISGFCIIYAIASAPADELVNALLLVPVEIILATALGISLGYLLRFVPSPKGHCLHFPRVLLLCSISTALYFGSKAIHQDVCGPIAVMLSCFIAVSGWKKDNPKGTQHEAAVLRLIWNLLLLPLLFVLIGLLFDFSVFTLALLAQSGLVILAGVVVRALSVFCLARANPKFDAKEALFFSIVFLPKATMQAALAPQLLDYNLATGEEAGAQFMLQTCILSILLTAPIGQILIQSLGNRLLKRENKTDGACAHILMVEPLAAKGNGTVASPSIIDVVVGMPTVFYSEKRRNEEELKQEQRELEEDIFAELDSDREEEDSDQPKAGNRAGRQMQGLPPESSRK